MTLSEATPHFFDWGRAERNYARETQQKIQDCFRAWILPLLGERQIGEIIRLDIIALRKAMVDRGVGISRQYSVLMALKTFFKFVRHVLRLDCLDPDREITLPRRKTPKVQYLDNDEVARLLGAINTGRFTGLRLYTLVEVLLGSGLRISEALSLDRTPFEQGKQEVEITGKGGKRRTAFFPARTLLAIKRFLYYRRDEHPALFITTGFPRRLSRSDISRSFIRLREKAGISKKVTPHLLRHTFCTNLLLNGADITFIKELAGHASIQTTARYYLGMDKRALRDVVDRCLDYSPEERPS